MNSDGDDVKKAWGGWRKNKVTFLVCHPLWGYAGG
jgi:hypothetical protein